MLYSILIAAINISLHNETLNYYYYRNNIQYLINLKKNPLLLTYFIE